ncbi:DUF3872 domain-containing protein [Dysgonomonas sp. 216]|uniref:DUF3872 domain-containing protein n=1 Tax=Dysgonomonas sp. 216 TaxID=2302934 RepID=UPI0013D32461|nr:DUF3872 domain-containing protein [Dysgonomonas sp. 216]NDW18780.1 DUF3872 domain-containing protein [Dysgonomonas sp. 216]
MKKCASYIIYMLLLAAIACACSDDIDIKQDYEFKVTHLPVPKKLKTGETAEIRCQLERSGEYENTKYFLRYFQTEGRGSLRMDRGTPFLPNDTYELEKETFRLYYTSYSQERAVIEIVFFDSFAREYPLTLNFNANSSEEK